MMTGSESSSLRCQRWPELRRRLLLLAALFALAAVSGAEAVTMGTARECAGQDQLVKETLDERLAVCNDGTPAIFYRRNCTSGATCQPRKWVIFLEGGNLCTSTESCARRARTAPFQTSSSPAFYKPTACGRTLLDTDRAENPALHDWQHVFIPYCSSDLHLGQAGRIPGVNFTFNGFHIVEAVLRRLRRVHGLASDSNTSLLIAGSSAGGVGALYHGKRLADQMPNVTVSVLVDSSWFVNYRNFFRLFRGMANWTALLGNTDKLCTELDAYGVVPCCAVARCLVDKIVTSGTSNLRLFVLQSTYDMFTIGRILSAPEGGMTRTTSPQGAQGQMAQLLEEYQGFMKADLYSGLLQASAITVSGQNLMTLYQPSCGKHVYLQPTDLFDRNNFKVNRTVTFPGLPLTYYQFLSAEDWKYLVVSPSNVSIRTAVSAWLRGSGARTSPGTTGCTAGVRQCLGDGCTGFNCNPTCPEKLESQSEASVWPVGGQVISYILAATMILLCCAMKVSLMIGAGVLRRKYDTFVDDLSKESTDGGSNKKSKIQEGLPGREVKLSVSCRGVNFHIKMPASGEEQPMVDEEENGNGGGDDDSVDGALSDESMEGKDSPQATPVLVKQNSFARSVRRTFSRNTARKSLLKNITMHFRNDKGRMIAIMGPSGSGKTTFLNLLTGRTISQNVEGDVLVRGHDMNTVMDKYHANLGYTLQLASPYYDELTVRENLLFCALMRLKKTDSHDQIYERVERVIEEVGLQKATMRENGGERQCGVISGGEKRRLCVAIQLLSQPSIVFLDEPTSGLDAAGSLELLHMLNVVKKGRLIVLTIHQPRPEIYYMFDRILLLCSGKVAFYGKPKNAASFLAESFLNRPDVLEGINIEISNPADIVLDLLSNTDHQQVILEHYEQSQIPRLMQKCIERDQRNAARKQLRPDLSMDMAETGNPSEKEEVMAGPSILRQFIALEGRLCRQRWTDFTKVIYIPLFLVGYTVALGIAYYQTNESFTLLACFSLFSTASLLFVAPAVSTLLLPRCLHLFHLETEDGVCSPWQVVLHTYVHMVAVTTLPIVFGTVILFQMVVTLDWTASMVGMVMLINLTLNNTAMAAVIFIVCSMPGFSAAAIHLFTALAAFFEGFLFPLYTMPAALKWLVYVNPLFYGFAGEMNTVLRNQILECTTRSTLGLTGCISKYGDVILDTFELSQISPHLTLVVLDAMTVVLLLLATLALYPIRKKLSARLERSSWRREKKDKARVPLEGRRDTRTSTVGYALGDPRGSRLMSSGDLLMTPSWHPASACTTPMTPATPPYDSRNTVLSGSPPSPAVMYSLAEPPQHRRRVSAEPGPASPPTRLSISNPFLAVRNMLRTTRSSTSTPSFEDVTPGGLPEPFARRSAPLLVLPEEHSDSGGEQAEGASSDSDSDDDNVQTQRRSKTSSGSAAAAATGNEEGQSVKPDEARVHFTKDQSDLIVKSTFRRWQAKARKESLTENPMDRANLLAMKVVSQLQHIVMAERRTKAAKQMKRRQNAMEQSFAFFMKRVSDAKEMALLQRANSTGETSPRQRRRLKSEIPRPKLDRPKHSFSRMRSVPLSLTLEQAQKMSTQEAYEAFSTASTPGQPYATAEPRAAAAATTTDAGGKPRRASEPAVLGSRPKPPSRLALASPTNGKPPAATAAVADVPQAHLGSSDRLRGSVIAAAALRRSPMRLRDFSSESRSDSVFNSRDEPRAAAPIGSRRHRTSAGGSTQGSIQELARHRRSLLEAGPPTPMGSHRSPALARSAAIESVRDEDGPSQAGNRADQKPAPEDGNAQETNV